jgi:hypothetical protein
MKITLLTVGKTDKDWVKQGLDIYTSRLKHYIPFSIVEIPELKNVSALSKDQIKTKEGELILKNIRPTDDLILLDERGKEYSSIEFAKVLQTILFEIDKNYELDEIIDKINYELENNNYNFILPTYHPKRKHQLYPLCDKCGRTVYLVEENGEIYYQCECGQFEKIKAKVK